MTTDQAATVQPATDDDLIANECMLVAYYVKRNMYDDAEMAKARIEYWMRAKREESW